MGRFTGGESGLKMKLLRDSTLRRVCLEKWPKLRALLEEPPKGAISHSGRSKGNSKGKGWRHSSSSSSSRGQGKGTRRQPWNFILVIVA